VKLCHRCGREIQLTSGLQRTDSCPVCHSDLKCCLNCRFFDPHAANQCREPQVDPVLDKDKANFCELFQYREVSSLGLPGHGGAQSEKDRARSAFDSLFKKE
jgi:hypothetical protein